MSEAHPWGWTPERRARQAAAILRWKPWTAATGPISAAGKKISSGNALRPDSLRRRIASLQVELKEVNRTIKRIEADRRRGGRN